MTIGPHNTGSSLPAKAGNPVINAVVIVRGLAAAQDGGEYWIARLRGR
jgi:hypothetical protein